VGVQYALTILLLTLLGIWLDGRFGTGALFTILLLLLGFVGATWSLVKQVLGPDKPGKKE
jgi:F0F1-type ATP synthase assembly protein I